MEHWSSPNGCHPDCPACAAENENENDNEETNEDAPQEGVSDGDWSQDSGYSKEYINSINKG